MARILAYTSPSRGNTFPLVPVLDELRSRGHEISVRTLASLTGLMRARGFHAGPIAPPIEAIPHDDFGARTPQGAIKRTLIVFAARALHEITDLRAAIDQERPDILLVDFNCWGGAAVAESGASPWASWCPYPLPLPSRDTPPFGPGFAPARGPLGRIRDRLLSPLITGGFEKVIVPKLNVIRRAEGLAPVRDLTDIITRAPLTLSMTAEPFEYPRSDWPDSVVMVGPCTWEPPAATPPWLEEMSEPMVLVTTSSEFQDDHRLVRVTLDGLADEPVRVVATVPAGDPAAFEVPPNARVERFLPHGALLERAVCAVTHGGMGATQKALAHGVPVCAVPFGRDQLEVARRVEVAGAGSRLPAKHLTPGRLRAKVREAIDCGAGARRVAAGFAAAGGPTAAADAIEARVLSRQISDPRNGTHTRATSAGTADV